MLSSVARSLGRKLLRPLASRKSAVYGIAAGLIAGALWLITESLFVGGSLSADASHLIFFILWGVILAPIVLVGATGGRVGSRTGSIRDGLLTGAIAGACFCITFLLGFELILYRSVITDTHEWHESAVGVLVDYAKADLILSAICTLAGAIVGGLAALVGRRWHHGAQMPWHESVGLAISAVSSIPAGSLAMTLGDERPQDVSRGRESQVQGVCAVAVVLKGAYVHFQDKGRNLAMRFASSTASGRGFFGLPKSCWYSLSAGLFSGLLWALFAGVVRLSGPIPASAGLLSQMVVPGLLLLPAFVILAIGFRLGWRNGSILDGLIAGVIASIVLTVIYSLTRLVVLWGQMLAEAHADHLPLWFELLAAIIMDVIGGAMFLFLGIGLGSLGALGGLLWRRRGQFAWRKYAALVAGKIAASPMIKKPIEELPG